jgi:uncharacterized protein YejL (UPF0352 family)
MLFKKRSNELKEIDFLTEILSELKELQNVKNEILSELKDLKNVKNEILRDLQTDIQNVKTEILRDLQNDLQNVKTEILRDLDLKDVKSELRTIKDETSLELNKLNAVTNAVTNSVTNAVTNSVTNAVTNSVTNAVTNSVTNSIQESDTKLRHDLHNFLMGVVKDIKTTTSEDIRLISVQMEDLNSRRLPELTHLLTNTNTKVNDIFFENELIKHQLSLEEEIRKYDDDLESLKIITRETINSINLKIN